MTHFRLSSSLFCPAEFQVILSRVTSRALLAPLIFWLVRFVMDEETKAWCEASGLTGNSVRSLIQEEFVSMQAIRAMTAEVIADLSLSSARRCLLKKAVLKAQSAATPPIATGTTKESGQLAQDLDALESTILALSQNKADVVSETANVGQGKTLKSSPCAHEAVYLKPRVANQTRKSTLLI